SAARRSADLHRIGSVRHRSSFITSGLAPAIHPNQGIFASRTQKNVAPPSLRGALATKQSIPFAWHDGLLRVARNDDRDNHTLPFSASPISSSTLGSSIVAGMVHGSLSAIFLMVPRRILPDRVFGRRPTVIASLKAATGPSLSRTSATTSFSISAGVRVTPAFSTRKPQGTSPLIASLMPSTAHSA